MWHNADDPLHHTQVQGTVHVDDVGDAVGGNPGITLGHHTGEGGEAEEAGGEDGVM
ncbi:hypothetical protein HPP92_016559 [Vanilla planifolia]|uniref:Uncharacterized protein n=1 Tax=Vanilla planifolia TaxID=51239 RepID=A0A835US68_VANPL|nr:hypothetical protein HPP92_016559 [Vanilla planifolia]